MDEVNSVALARILAERLWDAPDPPSNGWQEVVNQAIRGVRKFLGKRPDSPTAVPAQWQTGARRQDSHAPRAHARTAQALLRFSGGGGKHLPFHKDDARRVSPVSARSHRLYSHSAGAPA
jgi:hypothetical protein